MVLSMKKSVRFSLQDEVREYKNSATTCHVAPEILWWQPREYDAIHKDILKAVQDAKRQNIDALVQKNYGFTDPKTQQNLNIWAKVKNSSRGLERFVCETYGEQRLQHRKKIIEAVIYTQQRMLGGKRDKQSVATIIRTVSSTLSENAVNFARMLAFADRVAVHDKEMIVRVKFNRLAASPRPNTPPTGKSPIAARKHHRRNSPPMTQLPPRHPGPIKHHIQVSLSA